MKGFCPWVFDITDGRWMKLNEMEIEEDKGVSLSLSWRMMYRSLCLGHYLASSPIFSAWTWKVKIVSGLTCLWSLENTGSRTLLAMTRSMGESSQPSSCDLIGSLCVEVVAGVVVVVVVVLLGWNNSSIKAWKCLCGLDPFKATSLITTLMLTWLWSAVGCTSSALSWSLPRTAIPKFWMRSSRSFPPPPCEWWWPCACSEWPPVLQRMPEHGAAYKDLFVDPA